MNTYLGLITLTLTGSVLKTKKASEICGKSGSLRKKTVIHFQLKLSKGKTSCAFSQKNFEEMRMDYQHLIFAILALLVAFSHNSPFSWI
jgi:hypothetical protein